MTEENVRQFEEGLKLKEIKEMSDAPEVKISEEQKIKLIEVLGKEMVDELIKTVNKIETGIPLTKNHYGAYMAILSRFGSNKILIGNLLVLMGANRQGVQDALKLS